MKQLLLLIGLLTTLLLTACGGPGVVDTLKDADSVNVYLFNSAKAVDRVVDKRVLPRAASGYHAIIDWAKKNKSDWQKTTQMFAPVLMIEGKGFSLNVRKDYIVFTGAEGTYIRKTGINDFAWFERQLGVMDTTQ